jgi:16S rRNA (adenine1518-N6/adenine1519-N6)-dimethyltransferase
MIHKAKKSLGQNFLTSHTALSAMCKAGDVKGGDIIIEVGPGKGALTEVLLSFGAKVIAIEKDRDLIPILEEKFSEQIKNKKLDEGDIVDFDFKKLKLKKYKVIANIPYYITGVIIRLFLESDGQPENMVLLVQKEVADRIVARDSKESILSLSVKAYGEPKYILKVSKKLFRPVPKVDSAIIAINNISKNNFKNKKEEENFFNIIKSGFAHKRKMLVGNLSECASKENILNAFKDLSIGEKVRAEDISKENWLILAKKLHKN